MDFTNVLDAHAYSGDKVSVTLQFIGVKNNQTFEGIVESEDSGYAIYRDNESKVNGEGSISPQFKAEDVMSIRRIKEGTILSLLKLADKLDQKGFIKEVNVIDDLIKEAGQETGQLEKGIKVEKEHKGTFEWIQKYVEEHNGKFPSLKEYYKRIAQDHLEEFDNYYDALDEMEKELKKGLRKKAMDFTGLDVVITPDKELDDRELCRALRIGIAAEHDATHFYELIADSTTNSKVKEVMQDIANEEKVHVGEIEKLLEEIDKTDEGFVEEGKEEVERGEMEPERTTEAKQYKLKQYKPISYGPKTYKPKKPKTYIKK